MDEALLLKYPSLRKFEELGDDYEEWKDGREQTLLKYIKERPDFASLKGNPSKLLAAIDEFSYQQDFLISVGEVKASILSNLLENDRPKVIVELGGYLGYSAILFADKIKQLGTGGKIWSLEFEGSFAEIERELIDIAGLSEYVNVVTGAAADSLRKLKSAGQLTSVDFLFLDHVEDLYEQDLKVADDELGLLKRGALVVADNVVRPGAPEYVKYVRSQTRFESHGIKAPIMPGEFEDELEVTRVL